MAASSYPTSQSVIESHRNEPMGLCSCLSHTSIVRNLQSRWVSLGLVLVKCISEQHVAACLSVYYSVSVSCRYTACPAAFQRCCDSSLDLVTRVLLGGVASQWVPCTSNVLTKHNPLLPSTEHRHELKPHSPLMLCINTAHSGITHRPFCAGR